MKDRGIACIVIGLVAAAIALFIMPSTVSTEQMTTLPLTGGVVGSGVFSETYNLPRAQLREMVFHGGAVLFLAGVILFAAGSLENRLRGFTHELPNLVRPSEAEPIQERAIDFDPGEDEAAQNKRIVATAGVVLLVIIIIVYAMSR